MIVLTVVIIIAFAWFFTPGNRSSRFASDQGFRIYGRKYSQEELDRKGRSFSVAMFAGLNELIFGLTSGNPNSPQAVSEFVLGSFVLEHEAGKLGVTVDENEVVTAIEKLRAFQTAGAYDPAKYVAFEENVLKPRGFTVTRFAELVRDQLQIEKLVTLVGSTVAVTPGEFRASYVQQHQVMNVSVARLALADFKEAVQPGDEEVAKVYKDHQQTYLSPEKRVVSYVQLDLTEAEKALKGKELMEARQNLANRANDFGQELLKENANFADAAKKYALAVKVTPEFTEAEPPAELAGVQQAAAVAFKLTEKESTSDALPVGNGYSILHLEKVTSSRQLSLEEAKPRVIEQIKAERANTALVAKGNEARAKIAADIKAGKSFAEAVANAGLKLETVPPFSLVKPVENKPDAIAILTKSVELGDGELSDFIPVATGGLIVHLDKRDPIDEAQFKKDEAAQFAVAREQQGFIAFVEWLQTRRKFANVQITGPQRAAAE